jgi:hypothetical protein
MAEKVRTCVNCGHQTAQAAGRCARCGAEFVLDSKTRRRGWVLVGIGIVLSGLMGIIAWQTAPMMMQPGAEIDGSRYTGSAGQGRWILGLFGAVILLGVLAVPDQERPAESVAADGAGRRIRAGVDAGVDRAA